MATMAELQRAYNNPNVRKMLDVIASAEGVKHGYNTLFGNQQFGDLSKHPNIRKQFKQTDGKTNYTTAAGRYQFLNSTWSGLAKQYGFKDFSQQSQDLAAIALIANSGALDDVMTGRHQKAIGKLGGIWASLPSSPYAQPKRSWGHINKMLGTSGGQQLQQQAAYQPNFVDLKKVGIQSGYQPQFIDLDAVGIQPTQQAAAYKPEFVDMGKLEPQQAQQPVQKQSTFQPEFINLKDVGIG